MADNSVPEEVLRSFAKDAGFRKLSPEAQDRIVRRYAQQNLNQVEHPENVLQRTLKILGPAATVFGKNVADPTNAPGIGLYKGVHAAKSEMINKMNPDHPIQNFMMDAGSDPETFIGAGGALSKAAKGAKGFGRAVIDVFRPSSVARDLDAGIEAAGSKIKTGYSSGLKGLSQKYAGKTVSFLDELKAPKTLDEKKIFDAVIDEASHQKIDLEKLDPPNSKKVLDMIKNKSKIFQREIGSGNYEQLEGYQNLKSKQLGEFPGFKGIDTEFGLNINNYNDLSGRAPNILEGGGNRITKKAQLDQLKSLDDGLYGRVRNYRRANVVAKAARNPIVQAIGAGTTGIPLLGGLIKKFQK